MGVPEDRTFRDHIQIWYTTFLNFTKAQNDQQSVTDSLGDLKSTKLESNRYIHVFGQALSLRSLGVGKSQLNFSIRLHIGIETDLYACTPED